MSAPNLSPEDNIWQAWDRVEREERARIWRDAPYGYTVCRLCGYEKPLGVPCGEPCV